MVAPFVTVSAGRGHANGGPVTRVTRGRDGPRPDGVRHRRARPCPRGPTERAGGSSGARAAAGSLRRYRCSSARRVRLGSGGGGVVGGSTVVRRVTPGRTAPRGWPSP